ncbi:MAG: TetR family transcriptional regulator [Myxococcota bacterium]|nr:TetR family transcriptional regulator [Myxococcota bacterium]
MDRVAEQHASERAEKRTPSSGGRVRATQRRTEERLLEGALRAVATRGLAKLAMSDVSEFAGVSRGTAYRYFPNTEVLLSELGRREAEKFEQQVWAVLEEVPSGEERLRVVLDYLGKLARDHPLIQRLPETDPAFVLTALRERFPDIRDVLQRLLITVLEESSLVRRGVVTAEQLAGWTARMMISMFLFPEANPEATARSMRTAYQILAQVEEEAPPAPRGRRKRAAGKVSGSSKPRKKALAGPRKKALAGPRKKALAGPRKKALAGPRKKALAGPRKKALAGPRKKALAERGSSKPRKNRPR